MDDRMLPERPSGGVSLRDRVVLITGATGGIGEALGLACGRAGAQLILAGRQVVKLERLADALGETGAPEPILYPVELSGATGEDYDEMAGAIGRECGRLDAVVHLAADFAGLTPLAHVGAEAWRRTFAINLHAPMLINQAVHPLLRDSGGRLLFVLDDERRAGKAYWGAYGVSKFALRGLLSITAQEWENDGIGVCGVVPPPTRTRLRAAAYMEETGEPAEPGAVAAGCLRLLDPGFELEPGTVFRLGGRLKSSTQAGHEESPEQ